MYRKQRNQKCEKYCKTLQQFFTENDPNYAKDINPSSITSENYWKLFCTKINQNII